jgi:hypothetical protein
MAIIEPLDLSKEERQQFHALLGKLTEVIGQEAGRPEKTDPEVIIPTPEPEGTERVCDQESSRMGIVVPFDLSRDERQQFHILLSRLTQAIWQPKPKPDLHLVK